VRAVATPNRPRAHYEAVAELRPLAGSFPSCAQRILVADDYEGARQIVSNSLTRAGFEVDTAADGEAAWEMLQNEHYDLLVTDNDMPRLTGLELIKRIRDAGKSLPIILASASIPEEGVRDYAHLQIAAVLMKPFNFWDFLKTVSNALRQPVEAVAADQESFVSTPTPFSRPQAKAAKPVHNHVLIADDDPTVRGSLAAILESDGYVVDDASDGIEAVTRAIQHEPDLVLLDLTMPHADG
jgi:CheY-like chemotaxis protein